MNLNIKEKNIILSMKELTVIIDECIELGINIQVQENELKITGSKENLTPDIIHKIKENKSELIRGFPINRS